MKSPNQAPPVDEEPGTFFLESYTVSVKGSQKEQNEDSPLDLSEYGIFCLADGMGGGKAGKTASDYVVDTIREQCWDTSLDSEKKLLATLKESVSRAKIRIQRFSKSNGLEGVGSTIGLLHINPLRNSAFILYAGDTRIYQFRKKTLTQLTRAHSMNEELGLSEKEDISHIIQENVTRAIGLYDKVNPEFQSFDFLPNDILMISTSGLHKIFKESEITEVLTSYAGKDLEAAANQFEDQIKKCGYEDDISVILVKIISDNGTPTFSQNKIFLWVLGCLIGIILIVFVIWHFIKTKEAQIPENKPSQEQVEIHRESTNISTDTSKLSELSSVGMAKSTGERSPEEVQSDSQPSVEVPSENSFGMDSAPSDSKPVLEQGHIKSEDVTTKGEDPIDHKKVTVEETELNKSFESDDYDKSISSNSEPDSMISTKQQEGESIGQVEASEGGNKAQKTGSINKPIVISSPELGTSRLLVEKYNDGRVEMSELSGQDLQSHSGESASLTSEKATKKVPRKIEAISESPSDSVIEPSLGAHLENKIKPETSAFEPSSSTVAENKINVLQDTQKPEDLVVALVEVSKSWDKMAEDHQEEAKNLILKKLTETEEKTKRKNYAKGEVFWKILQQASTINDPAITNQTNKMLLEFETDYTNFLKSKMIKTKETCDWTQVDKILQNNRLVNRELADLDIIEYADAWCRLIVHTNGSKEWTDYIKQTEKLASRVRPLIDSEEASNLTSLLSTNNGELTLVQRCEQVEYFNQSLHRNVLKAAEKLRLNMTIIGPKEFELLINSNSTDPAASQTYQDKLSFIYSSLAMLKMIEENLTTSSELQDPRNRLGEFEKHIERLIVLFYRVQHHLRLLADLLTAHQNAVENSRGTSLFTDFKAIDEYTSKFSKIHSIFPAKDARELTYKFSQSFVLIEN